MKFLKHRNSQKRIRIPDASYFLTSKTHQSFPYFTEPIFCDLFVENLRLCRRAKGFRLYGWVLCHDHFHLLIQPEGQWNISDIMHALKRNTARNPNIVMGYNIHDKPSEGGDNYPRLRNITHNDASPFWEKIQQFRQKFLQKYSNQNPFPKFRWQESFHDHYARNMRDFFAHLKYIENNPAKHGLPEGWPWVFTNPDYDDMMDEY